MKPLITILFILMASVIASAQECPPSLICISQLAANKAAENARTVIAQDEKIKVLEEARKADAATIAELKSLNEKNVTDLKEVIKRTEIQLAQINGQLIAKESELVNQRAIITALLPMIRKKRNAFITIF